MIKHHTALLNDVYIYIYTYIYIQTQSTEPPPPLRSAFADHFPSHWSSPGGLDHPATNFKHFRVSRVCAPGTWWTMMNRWIWGYDRVCYCQTRPKWWKIDLDAVTLLGIWHEKGTNSAFALQGLHGSISWKDLLCCNRLCDNPDWCFFATLLWVKPKGDLIQWVKWQLRTVLQILLTVANLHKSRAANWSTRGLEPQHAWFRWSGEVWAVSANSQLSFSILWFHCPIHVTCPNWQRTKTPISSSCKTTLRNRHVPLATCTFVACSQLQPFATDL